MNSEIKTYSRHEAAKKLNVAVITIDRALAKNEIRHYRVGRRVTFCDSFLAEFLAKREHAPKEGSRA